LEQELLLEEFNMDRKNQWLSKKGLLLVLLVMTSLCLIPLLSSSVMAFDWNNTVHYYNLNDANMLDSAGTLTGVNSGTGNISGKINDSRYFNSYTSINFSSSNFQFPDVSYSFWLLLNNTNLCNGTDGCAIYTAYNDSGNIAEYITSTTREIHFVFAAVGGSNNIYNTTGAGILNNTWYHVIINGSGNGGIGRYQIYINGVNQSIIYSGAGTNRSRPYGLTTGSFFGESYSAGIAQVQGKIDEFAIFNKTLTTADISSLYGGGSGLPTTLSYPRFNICGSPVVNKMLNLTFKDEISNIILNASVSSMDITYSIPEVSGTKSYTFQNTSLNYEYDFCSYPNLSTINLVGTMVYAGNNSYPARSYGFNGDYSLSSMTNKTLYLLNADDGLYVTFQVVTPALQLLEGAQVQVALNGAITETKITDTAGSVTFWLNPNSQYNFTFSKTGYNNYSFLLYPTQSSYTVTMGSSTTSDTNNYLEGVSWDISPTDAVLDNSTVYTFRFNISSLYWDMSSYGFSLKDQSGNVVATAKGTTGVGSNLSTNLNVSDNTSITMEYYWIINGNQTNLTREWSSFFKYQGGSSLMNFFDDFRNFSKSGFNDFSRTLIAFALILIIVGIASVYGVNSPIAIAGLITALVWVFTLGGLIKLSPNVPTNYAVAILVTVMFIAYWYWEDTR
jgi:hypothetical protein